MAYRKPTDLFIPLNHGFSDIYEISKRVFGNNEYTATYLDIHSKTANVKILTLTR